jgi:hypothetical protein
MKGGQHMQVYTVPCSSWEDVKLDQNTNSFWRGDKQRQRQAAHSIQLFDTPGIPARPRRPPGTLVEDSSHDELTDYDDADGAGDPHMYKPRIQRSLRTRNYFAKKRSAWTARDQHFDNWMRNNAAQDNNWLLIEYMENGSLAALIDRRIEADVFTPPPNRVLWAFWLSCKLKYSMVYSIGDEKRTKI